MFKTLSVTISNLYIKSIKNEIILFIEIIDSFFIGINYLHLQNFLQISISMQWAYILH